MTQPKPGNVHTQVAVVMIVPNEVYEVELRFTFADGRRQVVLKGPFESAELATKYAVELQDSLRAKGGTPTEGVA